MAATWGDRKARERYRARKQYRQARGAAKTGTREGRRALYMARKRLEQTGAAEG